MPVIKPSNNQVLPANARASDVATKAVNEILAAQQSRYMSALRVQGYQGILYCRLEQGQKCTCKASRKHLNTRLGEDGKASIGDINKLLTGSMTFDVTPYGSTFIPKDDPLSHVVSPEAPGDAFQGVFDVVARDPHTYPNVRVPTEEDFGDNGPIDPTFRVEDLVGDFDSDVVGVSDVACAVCFGTSFVGGYAPFQGYRRVYPVNDLFVALGNSALDVTKIPWSAMTQGTVTITTLFPRGCVGVDSFKVYNSITPVPANFTVDGRPISQVTDLLKSCDGKLHDVAFTFDQPTEWTHLEVQFSLSRESPFFELPKLVQGSDTGVLDKTEPFQIILGPNVPVLRTEDIIVEQTFGKVLIVQNSNMWNTRNRNTLGWECTVRVTQPQEWYRILPKRGRTMAKNQSTNTAHNNLVVGR